MEKLKKWLKPQNGVTLVELLASLALLSLVVVLAMSIFSVALYGFRSQSSQEVAQDNATLAMKAITGSIRSTYEDIQVIGAGAAPAAVTSSRNCGNIQLPAAIGFAEGAELRAGDEFHYRLVGTELYNGSRLIADQIREIRFTAAAGEGSMEQCPVVKVEVESTQDNISLTAEIFIRQ